MEKGKKMIGEFKEFVLRGNIIDMAIGVIIGGAFGKIVTSLVNDILMPVIGAFTGGQDFSTMKWVISSAEVNAAGEVIKPEAALMYGSFIQNIIDFLIIAVCMFVFMKVAAKATSMLKKQEEEKPEEPKGPTTDELLTEIRDLLKEKK